MLFPVTLKRKINPDGNPYWVAEQKQLDLVAIDYEFDECLDIIRGKIKEHFETIGCGEDKFARLEVVLISARADVEIDIKVNRTLDEFTEPAEILDDRELECDYRTCPELEGGIEALPAWLPEPGDRVIYSNPLIPTECGLFVVCRPVFQDETDLPEKYCIISHHDKENKEIRKHELKARLELGPEKPCAKFCKDRACNYYQPRECSGIHECTLTGLTPSYSNLCPKDEETLADRQFQQIAEFLTDKSPEYSENGGIADES